MKNQYVLKYLFFCLSLFFGLTWSNGLAAQIILEGQVTDPQAKAIDYANVYLQTPDTSTIVSFTNTTPDGTFRLETDQQGGFLLVVSLLGYTTEIQPIQLQKGQTIPPFKMELQRVNYELTEVTITGQEPPVIFKKDTIIFDAAAFGDGTERSIEELLKKIPGIDVAENGTITVKGQSVETVMIEGDNLFEKGYMILTKNLSADLVDKVEVLENYSENAILKEVDNSQKVALNLTLEEDRKAVLFGTADPGYGTGQFYDSKLNLISLLDKTKFYSFTNFNNVGESGESGALDLAYQDLDSDLRTLGYESDFFVSLLPMQPSVVEKRGHFNNEEFSSLSFITPTGKHMKIKGQLAYLSDESDFVSQSLEEFFLPDEPFLLQEDYRLRQKRQSLLGNLKVTYDPKNDHLVEYEANYNQRDQRTASELLFNQTDLRESLADHLQQFKQNLTYTQKIDQGKVLVWTTQHLSDQKPQDYRANRFQFRELFPSLEAASAVEQNNDFSTQFFGTNLKYIQKENKNTLTLNVQWLNRNSTISNAILDGNDNRVAQKGLLYFRQTAWSASAALQHQFSEAFSLSAELEGTYEILKSLQEMQASDWTARQRAYLMPSFGLRWNMSKDDMLSIRYAYGSDPLSIREYYPSFMIIDYRTLSQGLGEWQWLDRSNLLATYTHGSWSEDRFLKLSLIYTKNHDYIATRSLINQDYFTYTQLPLNNQDFLSLNASVDQFLAPLSCNLKLHSAYSASNYQNLVNSGELRDIRMNNVSLGGELRSVFDLFFEIHLGAKWNYATYRVDQKLSNRTHESFFDLLLKPGRQWTIEWENVFYRFGNLPQGNRSFYFADLTVRFIPKDKDWDLGVELNNLFNTQWYSNTSISDLQRTSVNFPLLPRYLMLNARVKL